MKLLICFGTRPEAIKMAPICLELKNRGIAFKLCVTAQHREMLDQVLHFFNLIPDYDLNVMKPNQNLNKLSSTILCKIDDIFDKEKPNLVLVHGDTTSSSMIALAAFHKSIKVAHIEAGLRTYNKLSPFPEEINRQLTGRIADYHFAPTKRAKENLILEGVNEEHIIITGNTVVDALHFTIKKLDNGYTNSTIKQLKNKFDFNRKLVLVTGHRRENFERGIRNICNAILEISKREDVEIIYPVHLNPNIKNVVEKKLAGKNNIKLIAPIDYPAFIWLMKNSSLIISDSGGIQEEAPTFNIPLLVTRAHTERDEGIKTGVSYLVGTKPDDIVKKAFQILDNKITQKPRKNPYGDGKASVRILNYILSEKY